MTTSSRRVAHKHFLLDPRKIQRAQRLLGARTETETIERALDEVITEGQRNRQMRHAVERFVKSGARIRDVYGNLEN